MIPKTLNYTQQRWIIPSDVEWSLVTSNDSFLVTSNNTWQRMSNDSFLVTSIDTYVVTSIDTYLVTSNDSYLITTHEILWCHFYFKSYATSFHQARRNPGVVVLGGDSWPRRSDFESLLWLLQNWLCFTCICFKIELFLKRPKMNEKEAVSGNFFIKNIKLSNANKNATVMGNLR